MKRIAAIVAVIALAAGCGKEPQSPSTPQARLQELVKSNATLIGYLYTPDKPYVVASFSNGWLQWRNDPDSQASVQGQVQVFNEPDRTCLGFEHKNPSMPAHGPERCLVCEATQAINYSATTPRSQDFSLRSGTLFLEYRPPAGTGFPQIFYAARKP